MQVKQEVMWRNANFAAYLAIKGLKQKILKDAIDNKNPNPVSDALKLNEICDKYLQKAFDEILESMSPAVVSTILLVVEEMPSILDRKIVFMLLDEKKPLSEILMDEEIKKHEISEEIRIKSIFLNTLRRCGWLAIPINPFL